MWSIRLINYTSMGIPWMGSGVVGKAAFMLVRDVSVRVVMVLKGWWSLYLENKTVNWKRGVAIC
jgi:hypothetical protein